jgi:uncharacterized protein YjbI with pentapeptide repeats
MFNAVLDQAHCDGVDFSGANFSTSELNTKKASAVSAYMNDTLFNNAWVAGAIFDGAQLSGANLANSHLIGTSFKDSGSVATQFTPSKRMGNVASINSADISGTNFTGANRDKLDMHMAVVAAAGGSFLQKFRGYNSVPMFVAFNYDETKFSDPQPTINCPDGRDGPCHVE